MAMEVFLSYAHQDYTFRSEMDTHLSNLKRQGIITSWSDGDIVPGTEWRSQIMTHLNTAELILLLISADFMASEFCFSLEMTRALERQQANESRVLPIILRPCDWKGAPFAELEVLPTKGKPVTGWPSRDEAYANVVQGIRRAIDDLAKQGTNPVVGNRFMKNQRCIFLSHSHHDKPVADSIVRWLEAYGFDDIWYDNRSLGVGKLREKIGAELASVRFFLIVLLSPHALESDWLNGEINDALALRREGTNLEIIPIIVKPCSGIPFRLNGYKCLNLTKGADPVVEMMQLVKMIEGQEPSTASPEMMKQGASESTNQEPLKQEDRKFIIHMGNIQANKIINNQAEHISLTENNENRPVVGKDSWEKHNAG